MHTTRGGGLYSGGGGQPRLLSIIGLILLISGVLTATPATAASSGWELILDRPTPVFEGMSFVSSSEGWLVAGAGLLHTANGGATWEEQARLEGTDVAFADNQHGWFVSYFGTIYGTTDGGANWQEQTKASAGLSQIVALSPTEVVAVGTTRMFSDVIDPEPPSALLYTQDAGATWTEVDLPPRSRFDEVAVAGDSVWTAGVAIDEDAEWWETRPVLLRSQDRGKTWEPLELDDSIDAIASLRFVSESNGFARVSFCDEEGSNCDSSIASTYDGGSTWSPVVTPEGLTDFAFNNELDGWAVSVDCSTYPDCDHTLHGTVDGGATWTSQLVGTYPSRSARLHITEDTLYLPQQMLRSSDGGETWQDMDHPALSLIQVEFGDPDVGYAIGGRGDFNEIYRTSDAGRNWEQLPSSPESVQGLEFLSAAVGFASGQRRADSTSFATVSKTEDGGQTWNEVLTSATDGPNTVAFEFVDENVGMLAVSSALYITEDGGNSWRTELVGEDGVWIYEAVLANDQTVWASRYGLPSTTTRETLRSIDAGRTWSVVFEGAVDFPETLDFVDSDHGIVFGIRCEPGIERVQVEGCEPGPFYTSDGGATLTGPESENERFGVHRSLAYRGRNIALVDTLNGWAFAYFCADMCAYSLLHTSNGGRSWQSERAFEPAAGTIEFLDAENGWLLVRPGQQLGFGVPPPDRVLLYHTTDGGGVTVPTPTVQLPKVGTAAPASGSNLLSFALVAGGLALSLGGAVIATARYARRV